MTLDVDEDALSYLVDALDDLPGCLGAWSVPPYYRSLETVRRMAALVAELPVGDVAVVANKLRSPDDLEAIGEFCERHDLRLAGGVPWSDEVVAADRERVPVIEWPAAQPVVDAVGALAAALTLPRPVAADGPAV